MRVLRGADATIRRHRSCIWIELHHDADLARSGFAYRCSDVIGPLGPRMLVGSAEPSSWHSEFAAIPLLEREPIVKAMILEPQSLFSSRAGQIQQLAAHSEIVLAKCDASGLAPVQLALSPQCALDQQADPEQSLATHQVLDKSRSPDQSRTVWLVPHDVP